MKTLTFVLLSMLLTVGLLSGCSGKDKVETTKSEVELYREANKILNSGRYEEAVTRYTDLQATYPFGDYTTQGELEACYAHYKSRRPEYAIPCVNRFLEMHPTHPHIDYAYYLKGLASLPVRSPKFGEKYFKTQEEFSDHDVESARDAYAVFTQVVELFPLSDYAESARQILVDLINSFARHDLRIAQFYLNRDAYVAAINRSKLVLEQYSTSPHTEEALAILIYAYKQIGLDDLAADNEKVLQYNFPSSKFIGNEVAILDEKLVEAKNRRVLFGVIQ